MSNFEFLYPLWLIALAVIPLVFIFSHRTQERPLIAPHIAQYLSPSNSKPSRNKRKYFALWWAISVIALAGPSFQKVERPSFEKTPARVLVMDMSMSMYATDIKPNRLTQARYKALDLLPKWSEGLTGLVAYAGDAYTISPLTSDVNTIVNLIPNLSPDIMPFQGGNAASAVALSVEMMHNAKIYQGDIVLISDDIDDQERKQIESQLKGTAWRLSILAVGTQDGAPISLADGSMLRNNFGSTVIARTNIENMQALTRLTNGTFAPVQHDSSDVEYLALNTTASTQLTDVKQGTQALSTRVNNGFWLLPFILLPVLTLFRQGAIWILVIGVAPLLKPMPAHANPWKTDDQVAYQSFQQGDFEAAASDFSSKEWKGAAQYQAGNYEGAIESLSDLQGEDARYNLANAYAQQGNLEEAIKGYESVLASNPNHRYAQNNLDIVKQQQQQQQGEPQDGDSQNQSENQQSTDSSSKSNEEGSEQGNQQDSEDQQANSQQNPKPQPDSQQQENNSQNQQGDDSKKKNAEESSSQENQDESTEGKEGRSAQAHKGEPESETSQPAQPDQTGDSKAVDTDIRKLEQVESARDPSQLLRAQMILQAQQKNAPTNQDKKW
ncbi:VWA domain-containing protein [Vibrio sp. 99-70-13A1]|uniref:vWA domain-containing protein n=1 Tax=Vibrio sp. 99-70-13A1 TaxID=2607601 RepID=UPI00149376DE|nr:VWA domain-containing protein [Vibrio sp. 99-70-13A1]NOH97141.1 VWA domain-containing protein [Vibrio sp. 99-70-13A1]